MPWQKCHGTTCVIHELPMSGSLSSPISASNGDWPLVISFINPIKKSGTVSALLLSLVLGHVSPNSHSGKQRRRCTRAVCLPPSIAAALIGASPIPTNPKLRNSGIARLVQPHAGIWQPHTIELAGSRSITERKPTQLVS